MNFSLEMLQIIHRANAFLSAQYSATEIISTYYSTRSDIVDRLLAQGCFNLGPVAPATFYSMTLYHSVIMLGGSGRKVKTIDFHRRFLDGPVASSLFVSLRQCFFSVNWIAYTILNVSRSWRITFRVSTEYVFKTHLSDSSVIIRSSTYSLI